MRNLLIVIALGAGCAPAGAMLDGGAEDMATEAEDFQAEAPDLGGPRGPRRIFLSPVTQGNVGSLQEADSLCEAGRVAGKLGGSYVALLAFPGGPHPRERFALHKGREIYLPDYKVTGEGTLVASDETFWSQSHEAPIAMMASAAQYRRDCVWTGYNFLGERAPGYGDCDGWSRLEDDQGSALRGLRGDPTKADRSWAEASVAGERPCSQECHLLCIEVD